MHVIVVGCGRVGSELAVRLQREDHEVTILDKNRHAFRRLPADWEGRALVGFGIDRDDLARAGIHEASALAAVTSGDNTNILVARIARENFDIPNVVARIYDPRRALIYQRLGISTVATVSWTVDQVVRRLLPNELATLWTDPTGAVSMMEHRLPDVLAGSRLEELADGNRFRPVMVTRGGRSSVVGPGMVGQEGDVLLFAVSETAVSDLQARLTASLASRAAGTRS